jgi:hypothetical protein
MFAIHCIADAKVIEPPRATQSAGVVGLVQTGKLKVLMAARFALASHVTFVIGS